MGGSQSRQNAKPKQFQPRSTSDIKAEVRKNVFNGNPSNSHGQGYSGHGSSRPSTNPSFNSSTRPSQTSTPRFSTNGPGPSRPERSVPGTGSATQPQCGVPRPGFVSQPSSSDKYEVTYVNLSKRSSESCNINQPVNKSSYYDVPDSNKVSTPAKCTFSSGTKIDNNVARNLNNLNLEPNIRNSAENMRDRNDNAEISSKHEIFLKKLVANFGGNCYTRNRGFYCMVCDKYEIRYNKGKTGEKPPLLHDKTESHEQNVNNRNDIKRHYCKACRAHFFGDIAFWVNHLTMDLHKFFSDNKPKQNPGGNKKRRRNIKPKENVNIRSKVSVDDKPLNKIPTLSVFDFISSQQKENERCIVKDDLILRRHIIKKFHQKLSTSDKGTTCMYCHICELWIDNEWDNHNAIHESDIEIKKNMKYCSSCLLIIIGSKMLKQFHSSSEEHEVFKKLLVPHLNSVENHQSSTNEESSESDESSSSDNDDNNNSSDDNEEDAPDVTEKKKAQPMMALLLKDLPENIIRRTVFNCMKDYGQIANIQMHFAGPNTAKVSFKFRFTAVNIVSSGAPVIINGKKVGVSITNI